MAPGLAQLPLLTLNEGHKAIKLKHQSAFY